MIIDAHAHIFPDKIALKASQNIGKFYDTRMKHDGSLDTLLKLGAESGIDKFVVQSVATSTSQVEVINHFIAESVENHKDKLIGFAALHPDCDNIPKLVDEAIAMNLKGIKLHPDFQTFDIDSTKACKIYEAIEGRLPLLIHMGDSRTQYSKPAKLVPILDKFPKLDVIAAHFGGWSEWENAALELALKRVYVDTSSSMFALKPHQVKELIEIFGVDNVLFGTDYPMWSPTPEIEHIKELDISNEDKEKIFHKNVEKLLKKYE